MVDAGGLALMPGIIDLHTHYDAQVTWDPTLSPSPSLGVTTAVMGNCGFGIVPSPPPLRDMIMRNLAVVEGMDLDALRAGIDWRFQSFAEYMAMLRGRGPYMNLGVLVGHSAVRTAVMGEEASVRKAADRRRIGRDEAPRRRGDGPGRDRARRLLFAEPFGLGRRADAVDDQRFVGIRRAGRGDGRARAAASSRSRPGRSRPRRWRRSPARHGRRIFMSTAVALYNEQYPDRALGRVRRLRRGPVARQRALHPDHLPAAVVRFHLGERLSVLQPPGVRPDQGL